MYRGFAEEGETGKFTDGNGNRPGRKGPLRCVFSILKSGPYVRAAIEMRWRTSRPPACSGHTGAPERKAQIETRRAFRIRFGFLFRQTVRHRRRVFDGHYNRICKDQWIPKSTPLTSPARQPISTAETEITVGVSAPVPSARCPAPSTSPCSPAAANASPRP